MSDEKQRQREKLVAVVGILTKLKQADKVSSGCKKCHIINYLLTSTVRSLR